MAVEVQHVGKTIGCANTGWGMRAWAPALPKRVSGSERVISQTGAGLCCYEKGEQHRKNAQLEHAEMTEKRKTLQEWTEI